MCSEGVALSTFQNSDQVGGNRETTPLSTGGGEERESQKGGQRCTASGDPHTIVLMNEDWTHVGCTVCTYVHIMCVQGIFGKVRVHNIIAG